MKTFYKTRLLLVFDMIKIVAFFTICRDTKYITSIFHMSHFIFVTVINRQRTKKNSKDLDKMNRLCKLTTNIDFESLYCSSLIENNCVESEGYVKKNISF